MCGGDRGEQTRETTTCHQWWRSHSAPHRRVRFRNERRHVADRDCGTFVGADRNTNANTATNADCDSGSHSYANTGANDAPARDGYRG